MEQLNVGVIGPGWCGGIRAVACANNALVGRLHIAESNDARRAEVQAMTNAANATADWTELVADPDIQALLISATPETLHYPMAKAALEAGKHVLLEKPISITLDEADDLIAISEAKGLKFTIGYSQRFNAKQALAKRSINDGSLGDPVCILVSRHVARSLGAKIASRTKLSPAAMEATHDLDFAFWLLDSRRPVRVYSQMAWGVRRELGVADVQYLTVTMDDGVVVNIVAGQSLPPGYPNFSSSWIEIIGTDGALLMDATHKDIIFNTVDKGVQFPLSTMPGEFVDHMYAGPMERETIHFLEAVAYDRDVMVQPRLARQTMEVYLAADLSAQRNQAVELPLSTADIEEALGAVASR